MTLTWCELSALPKGRRVSFEQPWDIYAEDLIVPVGTVATIAENGLNEMQPVIYLLPDDLAMREKLASWEGLIHVYPAEIEPNDPVWEEASPLASVSVLADLTAERQLDKCGDNRCSEGVACPCRDWAQERVSLELPDKLARTERRLRFPETDRTSDAAVAAIALTALIVGGTLTTSFPIAILILAGILCTALVVQWNARRTLYGPFWGECDVCYKRRELAHVGGGIWTCKGCEGRG